MFCRITKEEQKRFTPTELLLYKHALEYRFKLVQFQYIPGLCKYIQVKANTSAYLYLLGLYQFKPSTHRWTAQELKKVIAMLQHPDFDSKDIDPDLHQRMAKAVDDGCIKCVVKEIVPDWNE